eukprot:gnl/MRDRNA2_/MRDRNA2_108839_c0_seq1.p1 gnl/MRDRNA2_/MRDRNA2_108839_c0~~gnl/MRDRNA2_/MRDRNA2_108839_c0_seq1.p1  ORF type:complete len:565 (+),score=101.45 gnl/MRDRNA2_/MRDRNA2_108839_c0_seq1:133-1827(+)
MPSLKSCRSAASITRISSLCFMICYTSIEAVTYMPGLDSNEVPDSENKHAPSLGVGLELGTTFGNWGLSGQEQYIPRHKVKTVGISAVGNANELRAPDTQLVDNEKMIRITGTRKEGAGTVNMQSSRANKEREKQLHHLEPQQLLEEGRTNDHQSPELVNPDQITAQMTGGSFSRNGMVDGPEEPAVNKEQMQQQLLHHNDQEEIMHLKQLLQKKSNEVATLARKAHAAEAYASDLQAQAKLASDASNVNYKMIATHHVERRGNKVQITKAIEPITKTIKPLHGIAHGWGSTVQKHFEELLFGSGRNHHERKGWASKLMRAAQSQSNLGEASASTKSKVKNDPMYYGCDNFAGYYITGENETLNLAQNGCDINVLVQNHSIHLDQTEANGTGIVRGEVIVLLPETGINGTTPPNTTVPDPDLKKLGHVLIQWNNGDVWTRKMCNDYGGIYWDQNTRWHLIQDQCHGQIINTRDTTQTPYNFSITGNEITMWRYEQDRQEQLAGTFRNATKVGHLTKNLLEIRFPGKRQTWLRNSSVERPEDKADPGVRADPPPDHAGEKAVMES